MVNKAYILLWVAAAGIGIGWMVGLSNSPVIANVLTPLLAMTIAALTALASLQADSQWLPKVRSVAPISLFIVACSLAATAGIYVRGNQLLVKFDNRNVDGAGGLFSTHTGSNNCGELTQVSFENAKAIVTSMFIHDSRLQEILLNSLSSEEKFRKLVDALCSE